MKKALFEIDAASLASLYPLDALSQSEREILAQQITVANIKKGRILVEYGASDKKALYLLQGKVQLTAADGKSFYIEQDSAQALRPISHLDPHQYTVKSLTPTSYIRIDNHIIDNILDEQNNSGEQVENLSVSENTYNNPLFQKLYSDLVEDKLTIPTLPQVVIQIQRIVIDKVDLRDIELIIQSDPAIATLIMKVANSALYRVSNPIRTIEQAILRMGLSTIKSLVTCFALRGLFNCEHPHIKKRMKNLWKHSAEVAAVAFVLARKLGNFDPEHALLLGLIHDIGMLPILTYAEQIPELAQCDDKIDNTIQQLHGEIGAIILKKWRFEDDFATVAQEADDWWRDSQTTADYCDLILIAQLHTFMCKAKDKVTFLAGNDPLPVITSLPAFKKLGLNNASPEQSLSILSDANHLLADAKKILAL